ncbi:MAG TPA: DNA-3-methyladenine glycosylase [Solirubrobacteraceae bacterium]|nr:DNA-3-methyladenine glycosylase [Solirubrobacteraceae bacterium]
MQSLPPAFYDRPVVEVARDLIGCTVSHGGVAGVIVETEAYHDSEPACHAFVGLTPRTRTLFGEPGRAYVYRSYGIHALLNAVCEAEGVGAAVLIRALHPTRGIERMRSRRWPHARGAETLGLRDGAPAAAAYRARTATPSAGRGAGRAPVEGRPPDVRELCSGPGKLTQALGVELSHNGSSLSRGPVRIGPRTSAWQDPEIARGTRVGITRAVELRWRFCVVGDPNVSRPRPAADAARRPD